MTKSEPFVRAYCPPELPESKLVRRICRLTDQLRKLELKAKIGYTHIGTPDKYWSIREFRNLLTMNIAAAKLALWGY